MKKVLHYLYGVPPVRGGGLVRYALDLISTEIEQGIEPVLLVPGPIYSRNSKRIKIILKKTINDVPLYKIINPLPIPMANGIRDIEWFTSEYGYDQYKKFLENLKPNVIHIHSLMGIHRSFFEVTNDLKIRIVFTSHDYFGICPKTDYMCGEYVCNEKNWRHCGACNGSAFGTFHLIFDQSNIFQAFMHMKYADLILRKLVDLKRKKGKQSIKQDIQYEGDKERMADDYSLLGSYYGEMWNKVNCFHFNSELAREVFERRLVIGDAKKTVIPICNSNCMDNRRVRYINGVVKIAYLGNNSYYKGFPILKNVADNLWKAGDLFELNVYFKEIDDDKPYIKRNLAYNSVELAAILEKIDLVVVPSVWKETFGLVVLEALSNGVPVVVTENVGAKMLLEKYGEFGRICKPTTGDLYNSLKEILDNPAILKYWSENIYNSNLPLSMKEHTRQIIERCYGDENE